MATAMNSYAELAVIKNIGKWELTKVLRDENGDAPPAHRPRRLRCCSCVAWNHTELGLSTSGIIVSFRALVRRVNV